VEFLRAAWLRPQNEQRMSNLASGGTDSNLAGIPPKALIDVPASDRENVRILLFARFFVPSPLRSVFFPPLL
jgi:hypothetical protein